MANRSRMWIWKCSKNQERKNVIRYNEKLSKIRRQWIHSILEWVILRNNKTFQGHILITIVFFAKWICRKIRSLFYLMHFENKVKICSFIKLFKIRQGKLQLVLYVRQLCILLLSLYRSCYYILKPLWKQMGV